MLKNFARASWTSGYVLTVYNKEKIANVEELRKRNVDEWERPDQRIIDGAVKEWRKRLRAFCIKLTAKVTPNKIKSANQHSLYVLVNIFTFIELNCGT